MCVIIHLAAKKSISWKQLQTCYNNNRDGWGIMWAKDGQLHHVKDVSPFASFAAVWRDIPIGAERAVHFRIKTHGEINKANCHPFLVKSNIGLMHNGTIDTCMVDKGMSDTFNYTKYELKPLVEAWPGFLDDGDFKDFVEKGVGYSKLLLMDHMGKVLKLKENLWTERNGIFFSNAHSLGYDNYNYSAQEDGWWKKNRNGYRGNNYYQDLEQDVTDIKSDLYCSNKTDTEGQDYITRREEEAMKENEELDQTATEVAITAEAEDEDLYVFDLEQLLTMSDEDKLDWVQDSPKSAVYVLNGLLDTLSQAGIFDIYYGNKLDIKDNKSVVNG